jgi:hypothetical protein
VTQKEAIQRVLDQVDVDPQATQRPAEPDGFEAPAPPALVKVPQDLQGCKVFDPKRHKHRRRGNKLIPMWSKPDAKGRCYWMLRPGPKPSPEAAGELVDPRANPNPNQNAEMAGKIPLDGTISAVVDPRAERFSRMIERVGQKLVGDDDGQFTDAERENLLRDLTAVEAEEPGSLPELSPLKMVVWDLGDYASRISKTDGGRDLGETVASVATLVALRVKAWFSGESWPPQLEASPEEAE